MTKLRRWFDRRFDLGLSPEALPDIVERLRGTPARLDERVGDLPKALLVSQPNGAWSIQENVGHLLDLEPLWAGRVQDLVEGLDELREADLENRKTHDAGHNDRDIADLLRAFRHQRTAMVSAIEAFEEKAVPRTALHPRLRQPMSVVDLAFFVAEHDDHHLARITEIMNDPG